MTSHRGTTHPLPVILPALRDELLSSWLKRHARFYGVSECRMLRHCLPEASSPRHLDLELSRDDQRRLADMLRCDQAIIGGMTARKGVREAGLIATSRPLQVCRRCASHHAAAELTRDARLRSWMAGWRMSCPVCRGSLEDVRPVDLLARLDEEEPLLVRVAEDARRGEQIMERGLQRLERVGEPLIELMRILLLPRPPSPGDRPFRIEIPRLLDVVVPGFDLYLREHYPYFRRPATLLLTIGDRLPVLAGIGIVAARPGCGAGKANWKRLMTCFRSLIAASSNNVSPGVSGYPALMGCSEGRQRKFSLIAA